MPFAPKTTYATSIGTAATVALDWMTGGPTTCMLTAVSTSPGGAAGQLQVGMPDITEMSTAVLYPVGSSQSGIVWAALSSRGEASFLSTASISSNSGFVINSTAVSDTRLIYTFTTPIGGLRFSCSAFSSGGFRMDVLQGRGF